jgi:hypothetical protein
VNDYDDEEDDDNNFGDPDREDVGACCACERTAPDVYVRNIVMLPQLAPEPGTGWGCAVCGLPPDGAITVVCDDCLEAERPYRWAVSGYPKEGRRVPIWSLTGKHEHRMEYHHDG